VESGYLRRRMITNRSIKLSVSIDSPSEVVGAEEPHEVWIF